MQNNNGHRIKQEIYNPFNENKHQQNQALLKATQENYKNLQSYRTKTPLYQSTNVINDREPNFKPSSKKTQLSDQKSMIFEFGNDRIAKEAQFKPSYQKIQEPGQNSDHQYKQQLKTSEYPNRNQLYRNPICDGDPKSEYVKTQRVKQEFMPKNQISFG